MACMSFCFRVKCLFRRKIGCEADYWAKPGFYLFKARTLLYCYIMVCVRRGSFGEGRKERTKRKTRYLTESSPRFWTSSCKSISYHSP